jgi:flagellar biogenesis protein FliO
MKKKIKSIDFTHAAPNFTINSDENVNTVFGGCISLIAIVILLAYFTF